LTLYRKLLAGLADTFPYKFLGELWNAALRTLQIYSRHPEGVKELAEVRVLTSAVPLATSYDLPETAARPLGFRW
jgi:hypothetical protein